MISFRKTNFDDLEDSKILAGWFADPEIRHLIIPVRDKSLIKSPDTSEIIQAQGRAEGPFCSLVDQMVLWNNLPIGNCTIALDPPHKVTKEVKTAWLGLIIGEKEFRAKGIGKLVVGNLEKEARNLGAKCCEAGTFEFNQSSQKLFLKCEFTEIGRLENFTFWNDRYWDDIRFVKTLSN